MQAETIPAVNVPEAISELSEFLMRLASMGNEVAFWRSKGKSSQLEKGIQDLLALVHDDVFFEDAARDPEPLRDALSNLRAQLEDLVRAIPFQQRVDFIHRPLVSSYQQMMILENLVGSALCRLRLFDRRETTTIPKGSLIDGESRRNLRANFKEIASSWDRGDWNVYDFV